MNLDPRISVRVIGVEALSQLVNQRINFNGINVLGPVGQGNGHIRP